MSEQRTTDLVPLRTQIALSAFWFSLSFQGTALLTIVIPQALDGLARGDHTLVLSRLAVLGAVIAMALPPIAGAMSDAVRRHGGQRRPMLLWGAGIDVLGIFIIAEASNLYLLAGGFLIMVLGQNLAGAAYQAMMPDMIPRDQWGAASGYIGVFRLLGTIFGLGVAGFASTQVTYWAMALTAMAGAVYSASVMYDQNGDAQPRARARIRNRRDFSLVFAARFAVMFGQTLLMTYAFYFFQDVMHAQSPQGSTAIFAGLAMVGAVASSLVLGFVSDRSDRPGIVALAGIPMAVAVGGFALYPDANLLLLYACLYGLGWGAYLSVDWALALDSIPDLANVARDLGIWGIASNLPQVIAPAVGGWLILHFATRFEGYRALFLVAGGVTLLGSLIVLGVRSRRRRARPSIPLQALVALILRIYVRCKFRVSVLGRLPRRRGATLVVGNHGHPMEGVVVPPLLFWMSSPRHRVYIAGSERIFEPGFLADRGAGPMGRLLAGVSVGRVVAALGVRPIENMTRSRPFTSLAYEVYRRHGDLPLAEVFTEDALGDLKLDAWPSLRLRDAWRARLLGAAQRQLTFSALREPYRTEVRSGLRPRVEGQLRDLSELLRGGATLYLTPEGRYTDDGRMARFRAAFPTLLDHAQGVYLAATSYDTFQPGRMRLWLRLVPLGRGADARTELMARRPVTASQVLARALHSAAAPLTQSELEGSAQRILGALPLGAFIAPDLVRDPRRTLRRTLGHMLRIGLLAQSADGRLTPQDRLGDPRFPHVADMVSFHDAHLAETEQALRALRPAEDGQELAHALLR